MVANSCEQLTELAQAGQALQPPLNVVQEQQITAALLACKALRNRGNDLLLHLWEDRLVVLVRKVLVWIVKIEPQPAPQPVVSSVTQKQAAKNIACHLHFNWWLRSGQCLLKGISPALAFWTGTQASSCTHKARAVQTTGNASLTQQWDPGGSQQVSTMYQ